MSAADLIALVVDLRTARIAARKADRDEMLACGRGIDVVKAATDAVAVAHELARHREKALAEHCATNGPPLPCAQHCVAAVYRVAAAWGALKGFDEGLLTAPETHRAAIRKIHEGMLDQAIEALNEWARDQVVTVQSGGWFAASSRSAP